MPYLSKIGPCSPPMIVCQVNLRREHRMTLGTQHKRGADSLVGTNFRRVGVCIGAAGFLKRRCTYIIQPLYVD
jgi:hypothetical protein